jgi:riboflavin synthase
MFTGIVSEIGRVVTVSSRAKHLRISLEAENTAAETALGESINVNGVCQTVVEIDGSTFSVDTIRETLGKTTLGSLRSGMHVNLEQAVRPSDRMGGHFVSGHTDCVGTVRSVERDSSNILLRINYPRQFSELLVPQGSIAVDGISLTVARLDETELVVAIIPSTWEHTTLAGSRAGSKVNLEFDIIGKYVQRLINRSENGSTIDEDKLTELGF